MALHESPSQGPVEAEAENRLLDRLDYALRNLRTASFGDRLAAVGPRTSSRERGGSDAHPGSLSPEQRRATLAVALGNAHLSAGALESAEREYRDALVADPGNGDAHHNLAVALARLGRLDEAEHELRAAEAAGTLVSPDVGEEIRSRRAAGNS